HRGNRQRPAIEGDRRRTLRIAGACASPELGLRRPIAFEGAALKAGSGDEEWRASIRSARRDTLGPEWRQRAVAIPASRRGIPGPERIRRDRGDEYLRPKCRKQVGRLLRRRG